MLSGTHVVPIIHAAVAAACDAASAGTNMQCYIWPASRLSMMPMSVRASMRQHPHRQLQATPEVLRSYQQP